jgi:hypothetical protein
MDSYLISEKENQHQKEQKEQDNIILDNVVLLKMLSSKQYVSSHLPTLVNLLIKVKTEKMPHALKQSPLNLAIVLDSSGSMNSHMKMENAKKAIIQV